MKKILLIFGTRPEAIKLAPVYNLLSENKKFKTYVCVTSQHKEMLNEVIKIFNIKVNFNLNIMRKNQDITYITVKVLNKLNHLFKRLKPDLVLVHGDTTTTISSSLSCFYNNIKVAHIEAGLRSFNLKEPFPEELNRKVTSILSDLHFSPTKGNKLNLIKEGVQKKNILVTGNTVIDSIKYLDQKFKNNLKFQNTNIKNLNKILNFNILLSKYILLTCHRRENFGAPLDSICGAIKDLAIKYKNFYFVYPMHLNPNIIKKVSNKLSNIDNIILIRPQNYINFFLIMKYCHFIITDSGGLQEEAPSLNKPLLVIRNVTERQEILTNGNAILVGTKKKNIVLNSSKLIEDKKLYKKMSSKKNPYGDGNASQKIIKKIEKFLSHEN
tara:strand:+ start:474 stop:1622 length:1149 start_codon:yes stop_codon:yes gene_type:complete